MTPALGMGGCPECALFDRQRRRAQRARTVARLHPGGRARVALLPLTDTLAALGRDTATADIADTAARAVFELGCHPIPVRAVAGTVARNGDFDRALRPLRPVLRERWQHLAAGALRGIELPPITAVAVGALYFVVDGHHRVSVAAALDRVTIGACVRRICTPRYAHAGLTTTDLLTLANLPTNSLPAASGPTVAEPACTDPGPLAPPVAA